MDDIGIIDLSQVEDNRKRSEAESMADDAQHGLGLGVRLGKSMLAGLDSLLLSAKNKLADKQGQVSRWVDVTPGVQQYSAQVKAIGDAMRPEWWAARADHTPEAIGRELISYAVERQERARKREARAQAPASPGSRQEGKRTYELDDLTRPGWLSGSPDELTLSVCRQTAEYMAQPNSRPENIFGPVRVKDWAKLSESTRQEYKNVLTQTKKEMKEGGVKTAFDVVAYLSGKCRNLSRSRYNSIRSCIIQSAHMQGDNQLVDAIRAMPPYAQLCQMLGTTPTPRQGEYTRQRKRKKDNETWEDLLSALRPRHADAVRLIRATGARVGECESIRLSRDNNGTIIASISSSKTGARGKGADAPAVRTIAYAPGSPRYDVMNELYERRGQNPALGLTAPMLRWAWRGARERVGGEANDGQTWTLHALRHAYARERKNEIFAKLKAEHGRDWRIKLYGAEGVRNSAYTEGVYSGLAHELGHTCVEMAKKYG